MKRFSKAVQLLMALSALFLCCEPASLRGQDAAPEALWLRDTAISPDGTEIAFTYQGDIWVVSSQGGEARILTMHEAYDTQPHWSPDGKRIAFSSNRYGNFDVFVVDARGGRPERWTLHSNDDMCVGWNPASMAVQFTSARSGSATTRFSPSRIRSELWEVAAEGARPAPVILDAVRQASVSRDGASVLYVPRRDFENYWRKFQRSAACDNVWLRDASGTRQLTDFNGDDHEPVWDADGKHFFCVSDENGWGNVWRRDLAGKSALRITDHSGDYVRDLSVTADGKTLAYSFEGAIYTCDVAGRASKRLRVTVRSDDKSNAVRRKTFNGDASEFAVAPGGKEIAFVVRGEVFACDLKGRTRRLTETPEQERHVSWSHDGNAVIYSSERNGSWNLYKVERAREEDKLFSKATLLKESVVYEAEEESFFPQYSPDDKEVAFIADRKSLKVLTLETGETRTVCEDLGYSYADGDFGFMWAPDGKWLVHDYMPANRWTNEVAVSAADGSALHNITLSGYEEFAPQWTADGRQIYFLSDRKAFRSHGGHGSDSDIFGVFLEKLEHEKFIDAERDEEDGDEEGGMQERRRPKPQEETDGEESEEGEEEEKEKKEKKPVVVKIDFDGLPDRVRRVNPQSVRRGSYAASPNGEQIAFFAENATGKYDLWISDQKTKRTTQLAKLNMPSAGSLQWDGAGKTVFYLSRNGSLASVAAKGGASKGIGFSAEMDIDTPGEFANWFEHIWRQTYKKFFDPDMQGIDWQARKSYYASFLPQITEPADFAELLSEMLGELNASHTGCYYRFGGPGDETADLGVFYDWSYAGDGLRIVEVIEEGPLDRVEFALKPGAMIWSIDGKAIKAGENFYALLNHKVGKDTVLRVSDTEAPDAERREIVVKPVPFDRAFGLLYPRWVKQCEKTVEEASGGRLGYVHVRGMNAASYTDVFMNLFGKYYDREALIVDTRFNGGGWLHDDLATLLTGTPYCFFTPRGRPTGGEPAERWTKPSAILVSEANYSDAHFFPYTYSTLKIGTSVGMPIPGTATAVWWETLPDGKLVFGIPMVGVRDMDGNYLENQEYIPDVIVDNPPDATLKGEDLQLLEAVKVLLEK